MKALFAILMTVLAAGFAGFRIPANPLTVKGKLVIHGHDKRQCDFRMMVKGDGNVLATSPLDSTSHFTLSFTPANEKNFDFLYIDSHHPVDTIFLKSFKEFESDQVDITFYTFKGYLRVDEDDHVICPKCDSPDQVSPLKGLPGYYYCAGDRIKF